MARFRGRLAQRNRAATSKGVGAPPVGYVVVLDRKTDQPKADDQGRIYIREAA